jgi:hypothetical protein
MQVDPNRCVVVSGINLIKVMNGRLWLSELYFRQSQGASNTTIHVGIGGELWMTKMTIQGDGASQGYTALTTLDTGKLLVTGVLLCPWLRCTQTSPRLLCIRMGQVLQNQKMWSLKYLCSY